MGLREIRRDVQRTRLENLYQGQLLVNKELREKYISLEMGIRDQFAMAVLSGLIANPDEGYSDSKTNADINARFCYKMADAMLEARKPLVDAPREDLSTMSEMTKTCA